MICRVKGTDARCLGKSAELEKTSVLNDSALNKSHIDLRSQQAAAPAVVLDDLDISVAGNKCTSQQGVRFRFDTPAQQHQVKRLSFDQGNRRIVRQRKAGIPGRIVVNKPNNGLHNVRVAANYQYLYFIHDTKIVSDFELAICDGDI